MDGRPTWTDCDEAGDYVVPNVLSPRDLVFRPDNKYETVPYKYRDILVIAFKAIRYRAVTFSTALTFIGKMFNF